MQTDLFDPNPLGNTRLYDQDYYLWIQETIESLEQEKFHEIDLENLIEEIEDMGRSEKRARANEPERQS